MPSIAVLPQHAGAVVVGGGTAGAVVAARIAQDSGADVLLLEAGPDYGPFEAGLWPWELLDASRLPPPRHDWNFTSDARYGEREHRLDRARVLGGCSAHNGCAAIWGSRADYDAWAAAGNDGWSTDDLRPLFHDAARRLRVRQPEPDELTPWQLACLEAAVSAGVPRVDNLNDLDQDTGITPSPVNIVDGVRWNTAFAYLDPARPLENLTIAGGVLVDRLIVERGRAVGLEVLCDGARARIEADLVVLSAGTYGSPAILLRSGIGPQAALRPLGIEPAHELAGVGENLHDHPAFSVRFAGRELLVDAMERFGRDSWLPEEQTIAKLRSPSCRGAFDLHCYPVGGPSTEAPAGWHFALPIAVLTPRSRGALRLRGRDPSLPPLIDSGYLSDPDDADLTRLIDGLAAVRELAAQPALAGLIGAELAPGPEFLDRASLATYLRAHVVHYYHPVGTCKMGPPADPLAVVDARGRVHGLGNVYVADASLIPVIPRANTNVPALVVGERVAACILADRFRARRPAPGSDRG